MNALLRRLKRFLTWRSATNTVAENLEEWSEYDWSRQGEEWSNSPEWKAAVVERVLAPHVPEGSRVLEIGPGAGRWTEHLLPRAAHLTVVDLTEKCIELCKERFGESGKIAYHVNDGSDLSFLADGSVDRIWSWDVFVHVRPEEVRSYVRQFRRLLAPGGRALIHHARAGATRRGWRSDMTDAKMAAFCAEGGLDVVRQFDRWGDGPLDRIWPSLPAAKGPDVITVIERPADGAGAGG